LAVLLFYVLPFVALGWYKFAGAEDRALVYVLTENAPEFLKKAWSKWGGHAAGNVIVLKKPTDPSSRGSVALLTHEMTHVRQCMILGPFSPVAYAACWLVGKVLEKTIGRFDAYYDHPMEMHARRCAGQIVDVVGYVEKVKSIQYTTKN
jgi:hypothetical protein